MSAEEVRHENSQRRTSPSQAPDVLCDAFLLRLPPLHLQSTLRVRPPPTHGSPLTCPSASLSLVPRRQPTAQPPLRHTHGIEEPAETPNAPSSTRQKKNGSLFAHRAHQDRRPKCRLRYGLPPERVDLRHHRPVERTDLQCQLRILPQRRATLKKLQRGKKHASTQSCSHARHDQRLPLPP